ADHAGKASWLVLIHFRSGSSNVNALAREAAAKRLHGAPAACGMLIGGEVRIAFHQGIQTVEAIASWWVTSPSSPSSCRRGFAAPRRAPDAPAPLRCAATSSREKSV